MKKFLKSASICLLAGFMAVWSPVQAASGAKKYISDIRIQGVESSEKAISALEGSGYTVIKPALYSRGSYTVYAGYKTTTDPKEAITDIASMEMDGGYTVADYDSIAEQAKSEMSESLGYYMTGIREFRSNYKAGSPAAQYAYKMLNLYREDDSGKLMGDYLIEESLTEDDLLKINMQANSLIVSTIGQYVSIGCTPYGEGKTSWMERLSAQGPLDNLSDADCIDKAEVLMEKFAPVQEKLNKYKDYVSAYGADQSYDTLAAKLSDSQLTEYADCLALYSALSSYKYGSGTLADLFSDFNVIDLYPMVNVLTDAEYGMMVVTGIESTVKSGSSTPDSWTKASASTDLAIQSAKASVISVYSGVDRTLMQQPVALTTQARRDSTVYSAKADWFANSEWSTILMYTGLGALGIATACSLVSKFIPTMDFFTKYKLKWEYANAEYYDSAAKQMSIKYMEQWGGKYCTRSLTVLGKVFTTAVSVLVIVSTVYLILDEISRPKKLSKVPGIMYNTVTTKANVKSMVRYEAVRNLSDDPTDVKDGASTKRWTALYTTKDSSAGDPITADLFATGTNSAASAYVPVHKFGETAASNILEDGSLYLYMIRDTDAYTAASVFSTGTLVLAAAGGAAAGLAVGAFAGIALFRRRKQKIPAES